MPSYSSYDESVKLLVKATTVMRRLNRSAEIVRHVESLREKYKARRNFIKLPEKHRTALCAIASPG